MPPDISTPEVDTITGNMSDLTLLRSVESDSHAEDASKMTMLPSPQPTPPTSSASAKVFALPELLTEILIHVSLNERTPDTHYPFPAKALFVLQRVNSAFQDTISHTKIIQQRMLLATRPKNSIPPPHRHSLTSPLHTSIHWFRTHLEVPLCKDHHMTFLQDLPTRPDIADVRIQDSTTAKASEIGIDRREASWRKMKLCVVEDGEVLTLRPPIDFTKQWEFRCEDDVTLGQLYDGIMKLGPALEPLEKARKDYRTLWGNYRPALERTAQDFRDECDRDDLWE